MTGLSGSGKSSIAVQLETQLVTKLKTPAYRLDGDNVRLGLNAGLTFTPEDRTENIRRVGEVAKLMNQAGLVTICAFISPYAQDRENVRKIHEADNLPFLEVFIDCPLEVLETRDPKGLYKKARAGLIPNFTGISAPYERPLNANLTIDTSRFSLEEAVETILKLMKTKLDV